MYFRAHLLLALPTAILAAPLSVRQTSKADYISHATDAAQTLNNNWYSASVGLWDNLWWNSANALTAILNLAKVNSDYADTATSIAIEVHGAAQATYSDFINNLYDDEGWWALAWVKAYDFTENATYLATAEALFEDMKYGLNATCGGLWWDKQHTQNNAIENELFLALGASLANRDSERTGYYGQYAQDQASWLLGSRLRDSNNTYADGFDLDDCSTTGRDTVFTYNQGVILGALVEMNKLTGDSTFLDTAASIAQAAINTFANSDGVMVEVANYPPDHDDSAQFKGVLARNLMYLQVARGDDSYVNALTKSADSIWSNDMDGDGQLGSAWVGPPVNFGAPSQSSGLDCLVAAAAAVSQ